MFPALCLGRKRQEQRGKEAEGKRWWRWCGQLGVLGAVWCIVYRDSLASVEYIFTARVVYVSDRLPAASPVCQEGWRERNRGAPKDGGSMWGVTGARFLRGARFLQFLPVCVSNTNPCGVWHQYSLWCRETGDQWISLPPNGSTPYSAVEFTAGYPTRHLTDVRACARASACARPCGSVYSCSVVI